MPERTKLSQAALDALLGKIAVRLGFLTPDQLKQAQANAEAGRSGGPGKASINLGDLLVSLGFLTPDKLDRARAEKEKALEKIQKGRDEDLVLGRRLVEQGEVDNAEINQCLRLQAAALEEGDPAFPRLANILVDRGFTTAEAIQAALSDLKKPASPHDAALSGEKGLGSLGKYSLLREVGRGGMGIVYEAEDTALHRIVALKIKLPSGALNPEQLKLEEERFIREAQLAAKLPKHPNIVAVYEAGILEEKHFLAMEFIRGKPLSQWKKKSSVGVRDQIRILRDVVLAVHHAHVNGVLHRDLKPDNVLVDDENRPYITDFGLAKPVGSGGDLNLTLAGTVVGTPSYMSPEQARGLRNADARGDVYSLGVILYEILAGQLPFRGNTPFDVMMKASRETAVPPSEVSKSWTQSGLDAGIEGICLKAMAKKPEDRYLSAQGFAEDLSRWLKGEGVRITVRRTPRPRSRKALLTAALAAGVVSLSLVFLLRTPSVSADLTRAAKYMSEGNYTEALVAYGQALARDPESAEARRGQTEARQSLQRSQTESERRVHDRELALKKQYEEKNRAADQAREDAAEKERSAALQALRQRNEERTRREEEESKRREKEAQKAEALAQKAEEEALARGSRKYPIDEETWKQAVNLLDLVDPGHDSVTGSWKLRPEGLASDNSLARIEFPYRPPRDYDFRISFTRQEGNSDVAQSLSKEGSSFLWKMGAYGNRIFGFACVGGQEADSNATRVQKEPAIQNGRRYVAIVQVRRDHVRAFLDGTLVASWNTDSGDLGPSRAWEPRDPTVLGVGTFKSPTVFHSALVLEVSGKGEAIARAPAAAPAPAAGKPGLPGVPPLPKLKEAEKSVRERFKSDYARTGQSDRRALAEKLLALAQTTKDDPAILFILLRDARDQAAQGGDVSLALGSIDALSKAFALDPLEMEIAALTVASRNLRTPEAAFAFVEGALGVVDQAVARDDFDAAATLLAKAEVAAKATANGSLVGRVQSQARDIADLRKEFLKVKGAEKTLEGKPEDPGANLQSAKYFCFLKRDWEKGLPRLAKGSDPLLRAAALKELAGPEDSLGQAGVGDGWWDGAEKQSGTIRSRCLERALDWYERAWPQSTGGIRARLRDRFKQVFLRPGSKSPRVSVELPAPWDGGQKGVCVLDDRYAHTGTWAVRISRSAQAKATTIGPEHPPVSGRAGERFTVSSWVLSEGTAPDTDFVTIIFLSATTEISRETLPVPPDQPFWTRLEKSVVCPPDTAQIVVRLESSSAEGSIWIDDLSLRRPASSGSSELLQNGSFEQR